MFSQLRAILILFLIVFAAGCLEKKQDPNTSLDNNAVEMPDVFVPREEPTYDWQNPYGTELKEPIACNDELISKAVLDAIGDSSYSVTRGAITFGQTFNTINCFVRKDNVAIISYNVYQYFDEQTAIDVVSDEKRQYRQQLFRHEVEEDIIGVNSFLFIQPVGDGELYRLMFIDDSRPTVVVLIRSNVAVERDLVFKIGTALREII